MLRFNSDGSVHVPVESVQEAPHVQWTHIDGPLMTWCGRLHWLTWRDRFRISLKLATVRDIARERWPDLAKMHTTYKRLGELPPSTTARVSGSLNHSEKD